MQCPRCGGSGKCPDCKGSGAQSCPACAGEGMLHTSRGQAYKCKSCQGKGSIACPSSCSSCDGAGVITEALQKKVRDTYSIRFANFTPSSRCTVSIISICVVFFLIAHFNNNFYYLSLLTGGALENRWYWQFISSMFMHLGPFHLAINMSFLWSYGPVLEGILGWKKFVTVYVLSGLGAALVSYWGNSWLEGNMWTVGGASGALFGIDGSFLALYWRWRMLPWEPVRSLTTWAALIIALGVLAQTQGFHLVDNWSHGGGFVAGLMVTILLARPQGR